MVSSEKVKNSMKNGLDQMNILFPNFGKNQRQNLITACFKKSSMNSEVILLEGKPILLLIIITTLQEVVHLIYHPKN